MTERRTIPMPVKYWSRAGLCLTDWCNACCESCYMACGPQRSGRMTPADAVTLWGQLVSASPHGCRVHLTGGEPFGDWPALEETLRLAGREGLAAEAVETNGFWADGDRIVRQRLAALDELGVERLAISADPFHQQFVTIDRPRRLAELAAEAWGQQRVRIRWADWLEQGQTLLDADEPTRQASFAEWIAQGRDRLNGRAAAGLACLLPGQPWESFTGQSCHHPLLRSKHVHVWPDGAIMPGVCAGIVLGNALDTPAGELWQQLADDWAQRPIVGSLAGGGPVELARRQGLADALAGWRFASKCHLCWVVRTMLVILGRGGSELAPAWLYRSDNA